MNSHRNVTGLRHNCRMSVSSFHHQSERRFAADSQGWQNWRHANGRVIVGRVIASLYDFIYQLKMPIKHEDIN